MPHQEVLIDLGFDPADVKAITRRQTGSRLLNIVTATYLCFNAVSTKVPGPAHYLGLARLFHHLAAAVRLF